MNKNLLLKVFGDSWVRKFVNLPKTNDQWERKKFMNLVLDYGNEIAKGEKS